MSETDSVETASRRLALALEALEAAAERRCETDRDRQGLANQVHTLGADRARLTGELDVAAARSRALETANREIAERIAQAIETIRSVLSNPENAAGSPMGRG